MPFSSLAAVARKSAGATWVQLRTVTGGTSGEDSRLARPTVSTRITTVAMVPSFRMSYRLVGPRHAARSAARAAFLAASPRGLLTGSGWLTPRMRTSSTCAPMIAIRMIGRSTMCHISIWPKFIRLKNAPTPTALNASLPLVAIHWESKFCWDRYPVKHSTTDARKATTPVIQVRARRPRQAAIQNLPHR